MGRVNAHPTPPFPAYATSQLLGLMHSCLRSKRELTIEHKLVSIFPYFKHKGKEHNFARNLIYLIFRTKISFQPLLGRLIRKGGGYQCETTPILQLKLCTLSRHERTFHDIHYISSKWDPLRQFDYVRFGELATYHDLNP